VNGVIQPYFEVGTRKVRFRIVNGSNTRFYRLELSTGDPLIQIGSDGGLLSRPVTRSTITIAPAERLDVIIDFSGYPLGTRVILKNQLGVGSNLTDVMEFRIARGECDDSFLPVNLREVEAIPESSAVRTTHPVHIHDIQWQILDINGKRPAAGDDGWKDTFQIPALGTVRVIGQFLDWTGVYVFHCHKLEHEDHAMMAQFEVLGGV
jgi:FtsP/CotA-like multicopper oxidase with cupredoxin domain